MSLLQLDLGRNSLTGSIPHSIGRIPNLLAFGVGENKLSGIVPASLYNISTLIHLVTTEYGIGGRTSTEGDVYSYGILLLEMLTRKRPTDELFTIRQSLHEFCKEALPGRVMEIVDSRMLLVEPTEAENDAQKERVRRDKIRECSVSLARIGIACSAESPSERMNIKDVIIRLMKIKEVFLGVAQFERGMGIVDSRMLFEEPNEAKNDVDQTEKIRQAKVRECLTSLMRIRVACFAESPGERMNVKDAFIGLMTINEVFLGVGIHGKRQLRTRISCEGTSRARC
ncbi:hypothetical protein RHSIM_RhsimUnG0063300 [Rhododendron simsii]|uniref:Uncharacterized protein n=1 Tax=Rhododendron simsii TaxID=118357 RepID=A0A834L5C3_RHOSS|nr:hypothetical protein RHSIM_RhsimUnG0063300 [Rhododendron simsii]